MFHKRMSLAFLAVAGLMASPALAGPLGSVDEFGDTDLSEYTNYRVLDVSSGSEAENGSVAFSSPSGALEVTSGPQDTAEQVLFMRDDVTLDVGEELVAAGPPSSVTGNDFGIAVSETPSDLPSGSSGDVRSDADYLFVSYRATDQLNSRGFLDGAEIAQEQAFGVNATELFIAHTEENTFELGHYDGGTRNVLSTRTAPAGHSIGSHIGFYADMRADGEGASSLDNLALQVPEPASLALLGLGAPALLGRQRRRA